MPEDVFGIVGSVVAGAFKVEAPVAEGGFGVVYRAHHTGFRALVALKCLKIPEQLAPAQQRIFLGQFRAEAELMFRLSASISNIVRPLHVDAFVSTAGRFVPFIALEWLDGQTLGAIVLERRSEHQKPFGLAELVELLTPVARALDRAHHFKSADGVLSIVHCDLKPENIIVARVAGEEVVKVLDFGIAKAKSVASEAAGRVSGGSLETGPFTPAYGAPEQWLPKRFGQTGPWTDVWGLALSMVEVLAGRLIIDGDRAAMMATVIDPERRPTPRQEGVPVSEAVEAVFARALALDPRQRYPRVGDFWSDLQQALQGGAPARVRSSRPAPLIPDLDVSVPPTGAGSAARISAAPPQEMELEFDLPAAGIPLELDAEQLADARRSYPAHSDLPSSGRVRLAESRQSAAPTASAPARAPSEPRVELVNERAPAPPPSPPPPARLPSPRPAMHAAVTVGTPELERVSRRPAPAGSNGARGISWSERLAPLETLFRERVWPGVALLVASVLVTLADQMYAAEQGHVFTLGPLRAVWLAGLLMLAGVAALAYRFFPRS